MKNLNFKKYISAVMALVIAASCLFVSSSSVVASEDSNLYDEELSDEIVTYIVSLKDDALLENDEVEEIGTDYLDTDEAEEEKDELLTSQEKVQNQILKKIDPDAEFGFSYTAVMNGFSVSTKESNKYKILSLKNVESVTLSVSHIAISDTSESVTALSTSSSSVNNACCDEQNVDSLRDSGFTGKGTVIAFIDNEFRYDHENFASAPDSPKISESDIKNLIDSGLLNCKGKADDVYHSAKIPFAYDYEANSSDTISVGTCHGTHVAGIIAGSHIDENGDTTGVAPDAQLVAMTSENILTECIIAAFEDACFLGVDVINCSWCDSYCNDGDFDEVIENVTSAGIMVVCGAGNYSRNFNGYGITDPSNIEYSTSGSPSYISDVFSVASAANFVNGMGVSNFSSYGTNASLELKPDITAVGSDVYSSLSSGTDAYGKKSGTSMSSPHMAGIVDLMNQYIQENYDLSVSDRILYCKDLLMSTATVFSGSPRLQGAGLVNVSAALKASAFFEGDNNLSKVSLYDNLTDTFDLTFRIKNITDKDVTYTGVKIRTTTDSYIYNDVKGKNQLLGSETLNCSSTALPESITVPADSEITVTIPVVLDKNQLEENGKIFTNGFYIDGYVFLTGADDGSSDINMPFMGFYGDWNKAPTLDQSVFSGNSLTQYTYMGYGNSTEEYGIYFNSSGYKRLDVPKLGYFYDDDGNKYLSGEDYAAFSPNGDEVKDSLIPVIVPVRDSDYLRYEVIDENGDILLSVTEDDGEKYHPDYHEFYSEDFKDIPDGIYTMKITGRHSYKNAAEESVTMKFTVDRLGPVISMKDADTSDITAVSVPVTDEYNISCITFTDGENTKNIYYDGSSSFDDTVDLTGFTLSKTYITADDCAGNSTTYKLVCSHSYTDTKLEPTCTELGSVTHSCSACGYSYSEEIPASGHRASSSVRENETAPTCTKDGSYDIAVYCSVCKTEISRETVTISATGHSFTNYVSDNNATCTENGTETAKCDNCDVTDTREIADSATGHSFTDYVSNNDALCTSDGTKTAKCDYCDVTSTIADTGSAKGHTQVTDKAVPATCTSSGLTEGIHCSVCGVIITAQETVPAVGHKSADAVRENEAAPTCVADGSYDKVAYCSVCGEELSREKISIPATGHTDSDRNGYCDICGTLTDADLANPCRNAKLNAAGGTVDYKTKVTLKATATGVPTGYYVAIYEGNTRKAKSDNASVEYNIGQMTSDKTYTVKIIDAEGNVQKDSDGNALQKTVTIKVNAGFFKKVIAFFRSIFRILPSKTIQP